MQPDERIEDQQHRPLLLNRAGKTLASGEWRSLALYSWETDQDQLVPEAERAALLAQLAAGCPATEAERAAVALCQCHVAERSFGQDLEGTVSGLHRAGVFAGLVVLAFAGADVDQRRCAQRRRNRCE